MCLYSRKLENEIETLEEKIDDVAKTHKQELRKYYALLPTRYLNKVSINSIFLDSYVQIGL
jgi:hypothetical protein